MCVFESMELQPGIWQVCLDKRSDVQHSLSQCGMSSLLSMKNEDKYIVNSFFTLTSEQADLCSQTLCFIQQCMHLCISDAHALMYSALVSKHPADFHFRVSQTLCRFSRILEALYVFRFPSDKGASVSCQNVTVVGALIRVVQFYQSFVFYCRIVKSSYRNHKKFLKLLHDSNNLHNVDKNNCGRFRLSSQDCLIYVWVCDFSSSWYIGQTTRGLTARHSEHVKSLNCPRVCAKSQIPAYRKMRMVKGGTAAWFVFSCCLSLLQYFY